jgi:broad specificity phosphatase PhoE
LLRARQTAEIIAAPHGLAAVAIEELTECDLGDWEGLDWPGVRARDPEGLARFLEAPDQYRHPGGESYRAVHDRASKALGELLERHEGQTVLVVTHQVILRTYLAEFVALRLDQARQLSVANGAITVMFRDDFGTNLQTLADTKHMKKLEGPTNKSLHQL